MSTRERSHTTTSVDRRYLELDDHGPREQVELGGDAAAALGQRDAAPRLLVDHLRVDALRRAAVAVTAWQIVVLPVWSRPEIAYRRATDTRAAVSHAHDPRVR